MLPLGRPAAAQQQQPAQQVARPQPQPQQLLSRAHDKALKTADADRREAVRLMGCATAAELRAAELESELDAARRELKAAEEAAEEAEAEGATARTARRRCGRPLAARLPPAARGRQTADAQPPPRAFAARSGARGRRPGRAGGGTR